jgi:hypothetical protein
VYFLRRTFFYKGGNRECHVGPRGTGSRLSLRRCCLLGCNQPPGGNNLENRLGVRLIEFAEYKRSSRHPCFWVDIDSLE